MGENLHEWANLLVRLAHFIAGIMWVGTSFYFVWLDSAFKPLAKTEPGVEGELYMVHGGFFYRVEKRRFGAGQMPSPLHWFIWEATLTWITGFIMLWVVYYTTQGSLLVDPSVRALTDTQATLIGVGSMVGGWFIYDGLFRSPLAKMGALSNALGLALAAGMVWFLTHTFSGRGAFIHLGAVFGTIMVTNVWVHILPNQRAIIRAAQEGREPDYELGKKAKRRSMHNSYMTIPVLFTMISNHFPAITNHPQNWLALVLVIVAGAFARHTMISAKLWPLIPAIGAVTALFIMTLPPPPPTIDVSGPKVPFSQAYAIVQQRCVTCHAEHPTDDVFKTAPLGTRFDAPELVQAFAPRIWERAVVRKTMPLLNKTGITDEERMILARWIAQGAKRDEK